MQTEQFNFLKKFILFSEMDDRELADIYQLLEIKTFPDDYTIFLQEEEGDSVFFLRKGQVKVIKSSVDGDEQILEVIRPGDVFGEVILFGIDRYPASTRTVGDVEVAVLTRSKFRNYYNNNPQIGWGMLRVMARKLARSQHKIENLGLRDTKGRLASLIFDMLEDIGDDNNRFILNFNRQELASFIGTSRETVSRTLSELKKEGIIELDGNKLTVVNLEGLEQLL